MNLNYVSPEATLSAGLFMKKNIHLMLMAMFLFIATVSKGQAPEVRKAFRFFDIEQPSKGSSALEQLVKNNPENASYLYYLGLAQLRNDQKDKALANFQKGIQLDKKNGLNYAGIGHVRLLEKNHAEGKAQLDKALDVSKSKNAEVLKAIAVAYLTDTKYLLDAISLLKKARDINNTDPDVHIYLGDALLIQNPQQGGDAVSSYERAVRADSKSGKPHFKIGQVWQKARVDETAITSYEKAIAVDPEYAPAYKELGQIYYTQKEAEKAVKAYEKYLAITETPGQAKFQYAFFLFMARDFEKANAIFREVTTNPDVSPVALKYYAYSLTEQGKTDEAKKVFTQYFQKAKTEDIQASDYAYYGKLLLKLDEDSLANESFAKSIALDSTQIDILELQAKTYTERKKYPEVIETYKTLINARKNGPLSQDLYYAGVAYYLNEQFEEADSLFSQLAERQPNMTIGYLWAGRARQNIDSTGTKGLAKPMYEQVIEKGSDDPEKNKKDLVEAYDYLGTYTLQIENDVEEAKSYFEKVLQLDPANARAKEFMKQLKAARTTPNKGR